MKLAKHLMVILFMLFIFLIGAVSASSDAMDNIEISNETDDTVTLTEDISVGEKTSTIDDSIEIKKSNSDEERIGEEELNQTSFMALDEKINNATGAVIELEHDYTYNETVDSEFAQGIAISKSLTIDGKGKTIDASGKARLFNVESNCNLILKNLTIVNCYSDGGGGAIHVNNANLTVTNCNFNNNTAKNGGVIYAYESNVAIDNSKFLKNQAALSGGILRAQRTSVDISNNIFEDSYASSGGSFMLLADGKRDLTATLKNNIFKNSTVTYDAGFFYTSLQSTVVENCTFENYEGSEHGGIVSDGNLKISDSLFRNSNANRGAALSLNGNSKNSSIINCIFENNRADTVGGAIYSQQKLTVTNSYFINNTAENYGGAIYDEGNYFDITDNSFTDNVAKIDGGAIYLVGAVEKRTYEVWVQYPSESYRLTIASIEGTSSMYNAYLTYDTLQNFGINDYTSDDRVDSLVDYYKVGNRGPISASRDFNAPGGFLNYDAEELVSAGKGNIFKNVFLNNNAKEKGGAIYSTANNLTIQENNFIHNFAKNGSAIWISNQTITQSCVIGAGASNPGFSPSTTKINLKNANAYIITLYDYELKTPIIDSYYYGNVEAVVGHDVTIFKNKFSQNMADSIGNAIVNEGTNTTIENNDDKNAKCGSTIYTKSQYVSITENVFDDSKLKTVLSIKASNPAPNLNEDVDLIVTLKDEMNALLPNQMIELTIQNKTYSLITDKNGIATFVYKPNTTEAQTVYLKYDGNAFFNESESTLKIKAHIATEITAPSSLTTIYNGGGFIVATLRDINGNALNAVKLSINLNGKVYTPVTDVNGQIKLFTDGLVPNSYVAVITFGGDDDYGRSAKSVSIIVKKATPKLIASNKKFKKSVKTKKYTITLKTNKNKPLSKVKVTLKVKNKTYKATTSAKGKATFKIKNLKKKCKLKATVTFNGNNCYNKVTKKVKITIK